MLKEIIVGVFLVIAMMAEFFYEVMFQFLAVLFILIPCALVAIALIPFYGIWKIVEQIRFCRLRRLT